MPMQLYSDQQVLLENKVSTKFFCSSFFVSKKLEAPKPAHSENIYYLPIKSLISDTLKIRSIPLKTARRPRRYQGNTGM
jgi:hypothetical protein